MTLDMLKRHNEYLKSRLKDRNSFSQQLERVESRLRI